MLVWMVIVMPTGAGKSTLFKFLKGILGSVKQRIEESEKEAGNEPVTDWVVEEATMEKMGALMCDNGNKLIGIYDELTHFLTQINIYQNRGLSDTHDLAMFLQLYNGLPWSRKTVGGECNFTMDFTSLTVGGFTQPTTATNIMVVPGNADKGLSQRFLWLCPKPVYQEYDSLVRVDQTFYKKVGMSATTK
ncbi:hypothetical protein OS493_007116 [Desmophyllum pertusum]|uniref:Uncharacterized protein n=1 Tax=Desmophyllum pertusum TaxID=174260 RepID=A0A9X0D023_9CNID|nr:hypothetical protein OS493_007116 [Desmophyllum pertusum]